MMYTSTSPLPLRPWSERTPLQVSPRHETRQRENKRPSRFRRLLLFSSKLGCLSSAGGTSLIVLFDRAGRRAHCRTGRGLFVTYQTKHTPEPISKFGGVPETHGYLVVLSEAEWRYRHPSFPRHMPSLVINIHRW